MIDVGGPSLFWVESEVPVLSKAGGPGVYKKTNRARQEEQASK